MSYLRLTSAEYRAISRECDRLSLGRCGRTAFRRGLIASLSDLSPPLASKIACLRRSQLRILHEHFSARFREAPQPQPVDLSQDEWIAFSEACVSYPLPIRFVRPFRHMLVELFREVSPELAGKLERLTARKFEELYGQAIEHKRGWA